MLSLLLACSSTETVTLLAASSLAVPMADLEARYEASHPGVDLVVSVAGSQTLARQVRQGLQADVLLTADATTMATVTDASTPWIGNAVVLAFGRGGGEEPTLTGLPTGARLIRAHATVPLGRLTSAVLAGLSDEQRSRLHIVSEEPSAMAVMGKLRAGEADAAWVFESDALREGLAFETTNQRTTYHRASFSPAGDGVVAFLDSEDARRVFRRAGFAP